MKRLVTVALLAVLGFGFGISPKASAHVLKQDNGISAVLHIDPDDNPVAGTKTMLNFDFSNQNGSFSLTDSQPKVTVMQAGKTIATTEATAAYFGSGSQAIATVTFPGIGVYDVMVTGGGSSALAPKFSLDYTERVATGSGATSNSGLSLEVGAISTTSLVILIVIAYDHIRRGKRYAAVTVKEKHHV